MIDHFLALLRDKGYICKKWCYTHKSVNAISGECSIRIHYNINDDAWSVGTTLTHPIQGKNTTWRNHLTSDDVCKIILYEREHIGKKVSRVFL
jgi:hypothetical protein